jgi:hypothetical protein
MALARVGTHSVVSAGTLVAAVRAGAVRSRRAVSSSCVVMQAEAWAREVMAGYDASHDMFHVLRVRKTALVIAKEEARSPCLPACARELVDMF